MLIVKKLVEGNFQQYNLAAKAAGHGKKGGLSRSVNQDLISGRITVEEAAEMQPSSSKEDVLPGSSIWLIQYKGRSIKLDFNPLCKEGSVKSDTRVRLWMQDIDAEEAAAAAKLEAEALAAKNKPIWDERLSKYQAWKEVWTLPFATSTVEIQGSCYCGIKDLNLILWGFTPFTEYNDPVLPDGSITQDPELWKATWNSWVEDLKQQFPDGNAPSDAVWW